MMMMILYSYLLGNHNDPQPMGHNNKHWLDRAGARAGWDGMSIDIDSLQRAVPDRIDPTWHSQLNIPLLKFTQQAQID